MSTSGDTVQYVEIDGTRYSHVIDPRTGLGLIDHYMATVIARRGMTSDALAKPLTVLGPERGMKIAKAYKVRAYVGKAP